MIRRALVPNLLAVALLSSTYAPAQQLDSLPLDVRLDLAVVAVERALSGKDPGAITNAIQTLRELDPAADQVSDLLFFEAEALASLGQFQLAEVALNRFLVLRGRNSENYDAALGLMLDLQRRAAGPDWSLATSVTYDLPNYASSLHLTVDGGGILVKLPSDIVRLSLDGRIEQTVALGHDDSLGYDWRLAADESRILTWSYDTTARISDPRSGRIMQVLRGHTGWVYDAVFSADMRRVATASQDGTVRIWNAETGQVLHKQKLGEAAPRSVLFLNDDRRLFVSFWSGTPVIWDPASPATTVELGGEDRWIHSVSADGRLFVTSGRGYGIRDTSGKLIAEFDTDEKSYVASGGFTADASEWLGLALNMDTNPWSDHRAELWDVETQTLRIAFRGHTDLLNSARLSPDETRVLTASDDGTARVWDAATGTETAVLRHGDMVFDAWFTPDGQRVITASGSEVRVWSAP